ncbi:MAG: mycofactocin biosynthesis chaperone MftB [Ilumatobacteraceae bacterium]
MSTELIAHPLLGRALALHPQVAVRPEPFGALAYHYGNRRLVFLQHADMVTVANSLADHPTLADALTACGVEQRRWPSFAKAFASLLESEVVVERSGE